MTGRRAAMNRWLAGGLLALGGCSVEPPAAPSAVGAPSMTTASSGAAASAVAPTIGSFTARPASILPGGTTVLSWMTQNATAVRLAFPTGESVSQPASGSLSLSFERRSQFTFTLTATGGGETATATTTVNVGETPNRPPSLVLRTTPRAEPGDPYPVITGVEPLTVSFSLCQSSDPDENPAAPEQGDTLNWQFHFGDEPAGPLRADGSFNPSFERFCHVEHTYRKPGRYIATVSVTDKHVSDQAAGVRALARDTRQVAIVVGGAGPPCTSISTNFDNFAFGALGDELGIPGVSFSSDSAVIPLFGAYGGLSGNALYDLVGSFDITFDKVQPAFRFDFLHDGSAVVVEGLRAGNTVFTRSFVGSDLGGICGCSNFVGVASGSGGFDTLRISSATSGFAIDNFSTDCPLE